MKVLSKRSLVYEIPKIPGIEKISIWPWFQLNWRVVQQDSPDGSSRHIVYAGFSMAKPEVDLTSYETLQDDSLSPTWQTLGFILTREYAEPRAENLGKLYLKLIKRCTFAEFCKAHYVGMLGMLFHQHGLLEETSRIPYLLAYLAPARKKFNLISHFSPSDVNFALLCVGAERAYGFPSPGDDPRCDWYLADAYRQYLALGLYDQPGKVAGDPIWLHEAYKNGELYEFLVEEGVIKEDPANKFWNKRLEGMMRATSYQKRKRNPWLARRAKKKDVEEKLQQIGDTLAGLPGVSW
ncbi:hypothetical protein EJ06DRAFT_557358 [Trichodelitschia bisporula]|uniref:Uncharacterized protein n=1 Tax=Trichodelitschia bisporula TaxID=703511 RepID=A0A6G1HUQ7_9PEZI|nr:hypothetical protein EJ06DRAFT_557358 [Trichodelitschia bisporula]